MARKKRKSLWEKFFMKTDGSKRGTGVMKANSLRIKIVGIMFNDGI